MKTTIIKIKQIFNNRHQFLAIFNKYFNIKFTFQGHQDIKINDNFNIWFPNFKKAKNGEYIPFNEKGKKNELSRDCSTIIYTAGKNMSVASVQNFNLIQLICKKTPNDKYQFLGAYKYVPEKCNNTQHYLTRISTSSIMVTINDLEEVIIQLNSDTN